MPPEQRTGERPEYTPPEKPVPKNRLDRSARPSYDQSRAFCKQFGVAGIRRAYRIGSADPETVAREVARGTLQPQVRDAVYSGCLAGLRDSS